jgi:multimeric flavodoxin WrbA
MKIAMINGSPKGNSGSSGIIVEALRDRLLDIQECVVCETAKQSATEIVDSIRGCDVLVFVLPLYLDSLPSGFVRLLDENRRDIALAAKHAKVYAVVQNGFYDAKQNAIAIDMIESFCASSGLEWGRGLGMGGGGVIGETPSWGRFPLKKFGNALNALAKDICGKEAAENHFVEPSIPRFLYMLAANFAMKREIRKRRKEASKKTSEVFR